MMCIKLEQSRTSRGYSRPVITFLSRQCNALFVSDPGSWWKRSYCPRLKEMEQIVFDRAELVLWFSET